MFLCHHILANIIELKLRHFIFKLISAQLARDQFLNDGKKLLPVSQYILPALSGLQSQESSEFEFKDIIQKIDPEWTVTQVASCLGKCKRTKITDPVASFIESMVYFCDIEAKIRFSLWPKGNGAPHHFSKLLITQRAQQTFSQKEILCILAIFADPKGLNLRNIVAHGFSFDSSLSLSLLNGIGDLIFPKLPTYDPPEYQFEYEMQLLNFHKHHLVSYPTTITQITSSKFLLLDDIRLSALEKAYLLFFDAQYKEALLLLFPIFEHSLRRAAVSIQNLPLERLCASSEEHFLTIKECTEILPQSLANMTIDLLFTPDGPRLRDRLMHGATNIFSHDIVFAFFILFEQCCKFFDNDLFDFEWPFLFHPCRVFEYEVSKFINISEFDLMKIYDSKKFGRLIEIIKSLSISYENNFKDEEILSILDGRLQIFITASVICFLFQSIKPNHLAQLDGIAHSLIKFGPINEAERFKKNLIDRFKIIQKFIPIMNTIDISNWESIYNFISDESINAKVLEYMKNSNNNLV